MAVLNFFEIFLFALKIKVQHFGCKNHRSFENLNIFINSTISESITIVEIVRVIIVFFICQLYQLLCIAFNNAVES